MTTSSSNLSASRAVITGSANRYAELQSLLRGLRLSEMAQHFSEIALKAAREELSHEAFLYELAQLESQHRWRKRQELRLKQSKLPREKTFEHFERERLNPSLRLQVERLESGQFLKEATNVVAVGPPGTGKSHLAAALGHRIIEAGFSVLWSSTAGLVQRLLAAKRDLRLPQELEKVNKLDCVILDDIGYVQHNRDEMEVLFTLLAERYERKSVIITTNLVFSEWERIFKDPMTTIAAIDRVVHHSVILDMLGVESYRVKAAEQRQLKSQPNQEQETVEESKPASLIDAGK